MSKDNPPGQHGSSGASGTRQKGQLPSKEELTSIFSSSGPIKDAKTAKSYLVSKSWLLQEERLNLSKISHILLTALLVKGIPSEVITVIKAVAFAAEDSAADHVADVVATKVVNALSISLSPNIDLLAATAKDHADTLVNAKDSIHKLEHNVAKLSTLHEKISTPSASADPTWAQIAASAPRDAPHPHPPTSLAEIKTQQRVALAARRLLVTLDPSDPLSPSSLFPERAYSFKDKLDSTLAKRSLGSGRPPQSQTLHPPRRPWIPSRNR